MNVRAAPSAPPLDRHDTEALAHALHGDPFRLLGPHDAPTPGRSCVLSCPGASRSMCCGARTARGIGRLEAERQRPVPGRRQRARTLSAAHRVARRRAGDRRPVLVRPGARRYRPASVQRRPAFRAREGARRQRDDDRRRARHALRRVGAERRARRGGRRFQCMGRAAPSDAAAPRRRHLGVVRAARHRRRALQVRHRGRGRNPRHAEGRSGRAADRAAAGHRLGGGEPRAVPLARCRMDAQRAPRATRRMRRSRSTRCISRPGCGPRTTRAPRRCGTSRSIA